MSCQMMVGFCFGFTVFNASVAESGSGRSQFPRACRRLTGKHWSEALQGPMNAQNRVNEPVCVSCWLSFLLLKFNLLCMSSKASTPGEFTCAFSPPGNILPVPAVTPLCVTVSLKLPSQPKSHPHGGWPCQPSWLAPFPISGSLVPSVVPVKYF